MGQQLRLERVHARRQSSSALPDLLRPDQPERRIVAEALRIVHVLIAGQPAVDGLPDQVGEWEPRVLAPRIGDVLRDQVADAQSLVQLAYEDEPAVGGDPRALELDAEPGVKRELKGLVLCVTHRMRTSAASPSRSNPHRSRRSTHLHSLRSVVTSEIRAEFSSSSPASSQRRYLILTPP